MGTSIQQVLINTPKSGLTSKPTSGEKFKGKRKTEGGFRNQIEEEYSKNDTALVMGNRLSWSTYEKLRKNESLEKRPRKRPAENSTSKHT